MNKNNLRNLIIEELTKELDEVSTTAGVAGYMTPNAFQGKSKRKRRTVKAGQEVLPFGKKMKESKLEEVSRYNEFKNDPSMTIKQKLGMSIREIKHGMELLNNCLKMNVRLQNESGTSSSDLWKRTNRQMVRIEQQLIEAAARIRQLRA